MLGSRVLGYVLGCAVGVGLVLADGEPGQGPCYKKKPESCSSCGSGAVMATICDTGWEEGQPGKLGPMQSYAAECRMYNIGDTATGPCSGTPTGFLKSTCPPDSFGECCFYRDNLDPDTFVLGYKTRPTGSECPPAQ